MRLNISDIQHFCTGDGEGIRTTVFFKGCNLCCSWCHNPETVSSAPHILRYADREIACGRNVSVAALVAEIGEDGEYYRASGGGATLSGGEPLLQAEGAALLAKSLRSEGTEVLIDTAGCVPFSAFEKVMPYTNGFLFYVKACTEEDYARIGGEFFLVRDNFGKLTKAGANVRARVPLIPNFNDGKEYCEKMCAFLRSLGAEKVDLLPFHRMGSAKYAALGKTYAYRETPHMSLQRAEGIAAIYKKYFQVKIER